MPKTDIKAMIKDLEKNELRELISVAKEILSSLFNSFEIRDDVKVSRFSNGYECPKCQCKAVNKKTDRIKDMLVNVALNKNL